MNLVLLTEEDFVDAGRSRARLTGRRFQHIFEVLKPSAGDELAVGLLGSRIGKGVVSSIGAGAVDMNVSLTSDPPAPKRVNLILALPRPIVLKRILAQAASLGVKHITLIHSNRVEKSYWKSPALKEDNIKDQLVLGLEQSGDTMLPDVSLKREFKRFVEDEMPAIIKGSRAFVAHPGSRHALPCDPKGVATLVIGPEGGFIPSEIRLLEKTGCESVHLGQRILRVETAVIAALARLGL